MDKRSRIPDLTMVLTENYSKIMEQFPFNVNLLKCDFMLPAFLTVHGFSGSGIQGSPEI